MCPGGRWAEECSTLGEKDNEFCAVIETCAEQLRALSHGGVVLAGAQTPTLVMSGLMGSPGSALREELFPCPLCSLDSEQRASSTPCALWGASFDERWGVKDGVTFAGYDYMFTSRLGTASLVCSVPWAGSHRECFHRHRETEFIFITCVVSPALICQLLMAALDEERKQAG